MSAEIPFDLASLQGFERLYRTYYGYAWAVLARLGVPSASVDDAHQDVFVTAYRRRGTFQRGRPVKPWLAGIARRVAFRYRRSQQRIDRKRAVLSHAAGSGRVPDLRGRLEAGEFLRAFIDELDPRLRDVFVLAELEGYTGPEIAERLAINLDTAYTRLRTARALLRRALGSVEEREAPGARVERGLVMLMPKLAAPGRLAWISALGAKAKLGLVSGVAAAGLVAAVAVARPEDRAGAGSRAAAEAREGSKRARVDVAARGRGDGAPTAATVAVPEVAVPGAPEVASRAGEARPAVPVSRTRSEPRGAAERGALDGDDGADLQREVEQLTAAREALAAGRPADALAHLDAHARAHPSSSLAEAHAALRIASLCAVGRREQARGEASILLRSHPGSTVAQHAMTRCDDAEP